MPAAESTFQYQSTLKKLPIPDLQSTCKNYLEILEPLQNESEHEKTVLAVKQFLNNPFSKKIDDKLREYSKNKMSYIEEFWYEAYLNYDSPVVLNVNPFFMIEDDPKPIKPNQTERASSIILSALKFFVCLKHNNLPPDKIPKVNTPLCMYQYTKLFASARIPAKTGCEMQTHEKSTHIIVLSKSQFYRFDVVDQSHNLIVNEEQLKKAFDEIIEDSSKTSLSDIAKSSFGLLTTENRKIWADIRMKNIKENNRQLLDIIDSALFVVCLDDIELDSVEELSNNFLCGLSRIEHGVQIGTCTNRWYDKLQIIITKNSKVGVNFEHTNVDGHTVLRFVSDIYTDSILKFARSINLESPSIFSDVIVPLSNHIVAPNPEKLDWELTPELLLNLRFSETRLSDLIAQTEFAVLEFKNYGADKIKKIFKTSPDAFIQMSFQAAYYSSYGKVECTYEPAMTKKFNHGRTEAIRTVSNESNLFVRKFFDALISPEEKIKLLQAACNKHSQRTRDSSNGLGVDRHLYGLYCIWQKYFSQKVSEIPSIFKDKGWEVLNASVISTSNCGNPALRLFGFGPVTSNGFGLSYIIKNDSFTIAACSKHRQTKRFINTLNKYFFEIDNLFKLQSQLDDAAKRKNSISGIAKDERVQSSAALNYLLGGYGYSAAASRDAMIRRESGSENITGVSVA